MPLVAVPSVALSLGVPPYILSIVVIHGLLQALCVAALVRVALLDLLGHREVRADMPPGGRYSKHGVGREVRGFLLLGTELVYDARALLVQSLDLLGGQLGLGLTCRGCWLLSLLSLLQNLLHMLILSMLHLWRRLCLLLSHWVRQATRVSELWHPWHSWHTRHTPRHPRHTTWHSSRH